MSNDVLAQIRELVTPSLAACGVELFDARLSGRPPGHLLRLSIDRPGGVSLDDCERVSHAVAAVLDAHDPIAGAYTLEVSSPGADRPLRDWDDWRRSVGRRVNVRFRSGEAETVVEGRLLSVGDDAVEVETNVKRPRPVHPRALEAGAPPPRPPVGTPVRIAAADVLAGRLAVEA